jgi:hypothetical protein
MEITVLRSVAIVRKHIYSILSQPVEMAMLTFLSGRGVVRFSMCHSVGPRDG